MLGFFRKYQKGLFAVVAVVVILSFSFFGVSSALLEGSSKKERVLVGKKGVKIKEEELKILSYLLSTDPFSNPPNFIQDAFFDDYLLQTEIASLLFEKSKGFNEEFWENKKQRIKGFSLYKHPKAGFLSVEEIWKKQAPSLWEAFHKLKETFSPENYFRLFLEEKRYPAIKTKEKIWQLLQQDLSLYQDPAFFEKEFSLFGFCGMKDWFSQGFIEEIAELILEGAFYAEKEGIFLSKQEGRQRVFSSLRKKFPSEKVELIFQKQLQLLSLSEKAFFRVWEKVLLFQKWLDKVGANSEKEYKASERKRPIKSVKIHLFSLKPEIKGKNTFDTLASQLYLEKVGKDFSKSTDLSFLPADEVKKEMPELVYQAYRVRWAEVTVEEASLKVATKKMLEWLSIGENGIKIREKFPLLLVEGKIASSLETLSKEKRKEIEAFIRREMVLEKKEWASEFLKKKKKKQEEILVSGTKELFFEKVENPLSFLSLLEGAQEGEEFLYQEGERVLAVELLEKKGAFSLFSLEEVWKKGLLQNKIEEQLFTQYKDLEEKNPSLFKEGGKKKPFEEVKELLGRLKLSQKACLYQVTETFYRDITSGKSVRRPFVLEEKDLWIEADSPLFQEALDTGEKAYSSFKVGEDFSFFQVLQKKEEDCLEKKEKLSLRRKGQYQRIKKFLEDI